ncbi:MAG: DUF6544 family protein [Bacteroidota bacterium]
MKHKKPVLYIIIPIAVIAIILFVGKLNLSRQYKKEVKTLFSQSKNISDKKFSYQQLEGLPTPVQKYFKHVMHEGQPYISNLRMTHNGQFKTGKDKDWINIEGEEYFTADNPGFIWKGKTSLFTARDMYISKKGRLVVSVLSLFNVVDAQGEHYDQGELIRWLTESILFPTNFLPGENLQWEAIDSLSSKIIFNYNGQLLFLIVKFNDTGEITEMETKRYMDENNLETWICKADKYKEMNGIIIPTEFEVLWRLAKGDLSYAKFNLKEVAYNIPENF